MNAPARSPIPSTLPPAAQAAIALVDSFKQMTTEIGAYLISTVRLVDGRYETALLRDGRVITEIVTTTEPAARSAHAAMTETLQQGLGPSAPAPVQAPLPASTVVWSIWGRDGEQEDIHGALYRTESGARYACADLQQRHPRMDWRVLPLEIAEEE